MTAAHSIERAQARRRRSVILIDEDKVTRPPAVDELWSHAWWALHLRSGQEWRARDELHELGYSTFLPVRTSWNAMRFRTKRQLEHPLFTSYLFVGAGHPGQGGLADGDRARIRDVEGVMAILGDEHGALRVPVENLVGLAGEVAAGFYDETQITYPAGQSVSLGAAFSGLHGVIEAAVPRETAPDDDVAVIARLFGRDTVVHIALADLRPVALAEFGPEE